MWLCECTENLCLSYDTSSASVRFFPWMTPGGGGGGGGTQMLFGRGCAAEASKPVPIFKGHFGGKGYPLLGIFSQENDVFVYFSDKMGEITKVGGMFRDFPAQNRDPCLGDSWPKSHPLEPRTPVYHITWVPPPPPGGMTSLKTSPNFPEFSRSARIFASIKWIYFVLFLHSQVCM